MINSDDVMIDANGNPFGLVIPYDWEWPLERVNIEDAYPDFAEYKAIFNSAEEISSSIEQWYTRPADSGLIYTGEPED